MSTPMPDIDEVVDLLGLEVDPKSRRDSSSYNVKCPFCRDKKYHMNINRAKNAYYCVLCTGDNKNTGVLDLYGRVRFGTPHIKGNGPSANGKELKFKLLNALGRGMDFDPCCRPREGCGLHLASRCGMMPDVSGCPPREGCGLHQNTIIKEKTKMRLPSP